MNAKNRRLNLPQPKRRPAILTSAIAAPSVKLQPSAHRLAFAVAAALAAFSAAPTASAGPVQTAAQLFWNGQSDNTWTENNWSLTATGGVANNTLPSSITDVVFSITSGAQNEHTSLFLESFNIHSLTVNDPVAVTIAAAGGGTLTISGSSGTTGLTVNSGAGLLTISAPLTLAGTSNTITVDNAAGADISGGISGSIGLDKAGTGVLTLTGTAGYSGGTQMNAGTLSVSADALGAGVVAFTGDSTLQYQAGNTQDVSTTDSLMIDDGVTGTIDTNGNNVTFATALAVGSGKTGALTKAGGGTLTLTSANTYTGATTVNGGTLQLGTMDAGGSLAAASAITVGPGGTLSVVNTGGTFANSITNQGGTITFGSGGSTNFSGASTAGSATITNQGGTADFAGGGSTNFSGASTAGSATITNQAGTTTDNTTVFGGQTTFNGSSTAAGANITNDGTNVPFALPGETYFNNSSTAGGATITNDGGSYAGGQTIFQGHSDGGTARLINNGNGVVDISGLTDGGMKVGSIEGSGAFYLGGNTLTVGGNYFSTTVTGVIADGGQVSSSGGSLVKSGAGSLTLTGQNTYTGTTGIINGGVLNANVAGALPAPSADGGNGTARTTLLMDQTGTGYSTLNLGANQAVASATGAATSTINLNGNVLTVGKNGDIVTFAGVIADGTGNFGSGGLSIDQASVQILSGVNTYTGQTMVTGSSELQVGDGVSGNLIGTSGVTVNDYSGLAIDLGNGSVFGANVNLNDGDATLAGNLAAKLTNTISSNISGAGYIVQIGAGTLILTGANTYSGATKVNNGDVQIGTAGTAGSIADTSGVLVSFGSTLSLVNVAGGTFDRDVTSTIGSGTVNVNSANTITLTGALTDGTGQLALTKNGPGTAIISGSSNTYTGATTVNSGILEVDGALGITTVTVNKLAALSGDGTIQGNVNILSGGVLEMETAFPGLPTVDGNIVLNSGANTVLRLGAPSTDDNDLAQGNLTIAGNLHLTPLAGFGPGTYPLFYYGGTLTNHGFSSITGLPGYTTKITVSGGQVNLVVSLAGALPEQYWDGTTTTGSGSISGGDGPWDASLTNWTTFSGTPNSKWLGGTAVFNPPGGAVTLESALSAQGLIFDDDGYSINGTSKLTLSGKAPLVTVTDNSDTATINAPIASANGLIANGAGTLVLANASNAITGQVSIITGAVQLGTAGTASSLGASNAVILSDGGVLQVVNAVGNKMGNAIGAGLGQTGLVVMNAANAITLSGALTDGSPGQLSLTQAGTGTTILTNAKNTFSGATTIDEGVLQVGSAAAAGSMGASSVVSFDGSGTLSLVNVSGNVFANSVTIAGNGFGSLATNSTANLTLSGNVTAGAGTLEFFQNGTGTVTLSGSDALTTAQVNAGTLQVGNGTTVSTSISSSSSTVQVAAKATLATNLASGAIFANAVSLNDPTASFNALQTGTNTLTGAISGSGAFNQKGTGTTILTAAETYTGPTTVSAGTLQVGNNTSGSLSGPGAVTVSGTGSLVMDLLDGSTFGNNITLSGGTSSLKFIQSGYTLVSHVISGQGAFDQNGPGATELGAAETYTGSTNVNGGYLYVDTSLASSTVNANAGTLEFDGTLPAASTVHVATAGTLTGFGTIKGNATLTGGGAIGFFDPAAGIGGTLTITGGNWTGTGTVTKAVTASGAATNTFTIGAGANLIATAGLTVSGGTLAGPGTLTGNLNYTSSASSIFDGVVAGSHSLTMNKAGSTLTLNGSNTYTGATTVTAGTLQIGDGTNGALASGTAVTVNGTGVLALNLPDGSTFTNNVTLNGATTALKAIQAGPTIFNTGVISGSGGIDDIGGGNIIISGTTNETYTGPTNVTESTLEVDGSLAAGSTVNVGTNGFLTGAGTIKGNATLTRGTISFNGGSISGKLTVTGGNWFTNGTVGGVVTSSSSNFSLFANLTAPSGLSVTGGTITTISGITLAGSLNYTSASGSTFSGIIADGTAKSSVTMNNAGSTLTLNGSNTYTGATTVSAGTLQIGDGSNGSLSSSTAVTANGTGILALNLPDGSTFTNNVTLNGATTELKAIQTGGTTFSTGVISGSGGIDESGGGKITISGGTNETYTGPTNVTTGVLEVDGSLAAGSTVNIGTNGLLAGTGTIKGNATLTGSGSIALNGGTIGGKLGVTGGSWIGDGTVNGVVTSSSSTFNIGANLTAPSGFSVTGGTIATTFGITLTGSLNYASAASSVFTGLIADGTSESTLTMNKAGSTLTLGHYSTYSGGTTINAGTLLAENGGLSATGSGPVKVNSGGILGGTGFITGAVTVNSGGALSPSAGSTPSELSVGSLTLETGAKVDYQLGAAGVGLNDSDETSVTGTLALGGALNITPLFGFGAGTYELFNSGSAPTGTLSMGTIPSGFVASDFHIQTVGTQVNLVVTGGPTVQYWNGAGGNGINGGSGTWDNVNANWTNSAGSANVAWANSVAVFSAASGTVGVAANVTAPSLGFVPGAGAYFLTVSPTGNLTISGKGVTNTSGVAQTFVTSVDAVAGNFGKITFTNSATAGSATQFTNEGASFASATSGGALTFENTSTAGSATITNYGATAGTNRFTGGGTFFQGTSTAGSAAITNEGTALNNAYGGFTEFENSASAGNATLTNNTGQNFGLGGATYFTGTSDGGTAQASTNGSAFMDISGLTSSGMKIGSIAGGGFYFLGNKTLTVGGNDMSTTVAGSVADGGFDNGTGGSLVKTGTGTLTLSGQDTYSGATTVNAGTLQIGDGTSTRTSMATSGVTVAANATLALAMADGGIFSNPVTNNGHVVGTGAGNSFTVASTIKGTGNLTQSGTDIMTVTGANTYSGGTVVNNGTLVVANTSGSGTGTGAVTVNNGGTLAGSGKITGAVALNSGGTIAPSAGQVVATPTTLHGSSVTWNGGGTLDLQLGPTSGDELVLGGALTKGSAGAYTLDLFNIGIGSQTTYTLATFASTTFKVTDFTLELPVNYTGTLVETSTSLEIENLVDPPPSPNALSEGADALASGDSAEISSPSTAFTPDTDSTASLSVTPTPEPTSAALLAFGGTALLGCWRRRRG